MKVSKENRARSAFAVERGDEVRHRSQQCWGKKKSLAWQRIRFYKNLGFNPSLEWAARHLDDVPSRPGRMNQRVYARLVARLDKYGPLAQSAD